MTLAQRAIIGVGMMVFGVMGLLPPWVHVYADDPPDRVPAGYAFVTVGTPVRPDGPNDPDALPRRGRFRPSYRGTPLRSWSSEIDLRRLAVQWGAVSVATGSLIWLVGVKRSSSKRH